MKIFLAGNAVVFLDLHFYHCRFSGICRSVYKINIVKFHNLFFHRHRIDSMPFGQFCRLAIAIIIHQVVALGNINC